ncbi:ABC transporter permease [Paenibacillus ihumii]|uniref:ABC transporter permease n=1 Tax=Paenibacillus ihumii TaxID=687436 RepID=UPI0009F96239|nr:ABC transporter permease [Paenibacillus ihumii]
MGLMSNSFKNIFKAGFRETVRDGKTMFFINFFPIFFIGLFALIGVQVGEINGIPAFEFMLPGLLTFILLQIAVFTVMQPLVEIKKNGTMALFELTPLKKKDFIFSMLLLRMIYGLVWIIIFIGIFLSLGSIHISQISLLLVVVSLGMFMVFSFGIMLSTFFNSVEAAGTWGGFIIVFIYMFSGSGGMLPNVKGFMKIVSQFNPFSYLTQAIQQSLFKNIAITFPLYVHLIIIIGTGLLFMIVSIKTFKWSLEGK